MRTRALVITVTTALAAGLTLSGCSLSGSGDDTSTKGSGQVVLVTHDSFTLPKELKAAFEKKTGEKLVIRQSGDAGALTNKLVLTKDDPAGDVAFGVDNTFASRALGAGVFADYTPADLPAGADAFDLPGDDGKKLTPVDNGNVCVNVDTTWFAAHHVAAPATLDDLTKPAYKNLFVTPGATTSSPGLAFLLATVAKYGDPSTGSGQAGWQAYWKKLLANGTKVVDGWEDAYTVDFTQGGGKGSRPIVLSYDSSPAFTVAGGTSTTKALLDTCFTQVEYAGVLTGAKNPKGARELVDFLLTPQVQAALPDAMYVFPVAKGTPLPADWAKFAVQPTNPWTVSPQAIDAHRDEWLRTWSDLVSQ
ncbi:thiamine ABC transporter substrate-binding protein [Nocardioides sp. CER19]|uniref:thiamine ABC transporter substrate-binding protein n=1 Tax=Nocardioides sp. CER19 TaxID=3038538 RepID=UPI00244C0EAE|nr:thiamine ABC transporter substrate-binding protein [Nocardioides sp. CER19]MDH2414197.1 thiamine ABC transporter substrate-binding protein [Nocardioides sp. CER19]